MASKQQVFDAILDCGIAAVVRADSAGTAMRAIDAALEGGVCVIEVTFTVPGALEIIGELARKKSGGVILGAGTVTDARTAASALDAGAQFIVSPVTEPEVIDAAHEADAPVFPGALTPSEVFRAWHLGGDIIKVFPGNAVGPGYIKDLHGPFPGLPLMPTGGVDLTTARAWLEAGAVALGVGGALIDRKLIAAGNYEEITTRARGFREIVAQFRSEATR